MVLSVRAFKYRDCRIIMEAHSWTVKWKKSTVPPAFSSTSNSGKHKLKTFPRALVFLVTSDTRSSKAIPLSSSCFVSGLRATSIHCKIRIAVRWIGVLAVPQMRVTILSYLCWISLGGASSAGDHVQSRQFFRQCINRLP